MSTPQTFELGILNKGYFDGGDGGPLRYTPEQMAQTCAEMELDLEITVRANGHIKPERAPDELPPMADALAKKGRKLLCLALDTVRPDEPHWQNTVLTAKKLGLKQYRHRGFKYAPGQPLKQQVANFHAMAREFADFNRQVGLQAVYQIHCGREMAGGAAWDLDMILGDIDPKWFAIAFDVRHVMVEQGLSWPNAVELLGPRIAALCIKSFKWDGKKPVDVPLGRGNVDQEIVKQVVAAHGGPLPTFIHLEHRPAVPVPFAQRAEIVEAFRADARVLRGWLGI
jgi:L-ribulose-5-phosphate 3-epimerase